MFFQRTTLEKDGFWAAVILWEQGGEMESERMGRWPEWHWGLCSTCQRGLALPFADSHPGPTGIIGTIDSHLFLMSATDSLADISLKNSYWQEQRVEDTGQMIHSGTNTIALQLTLLLAVTFALACNGGKCLVSTAEVMYILWLDMTCNITLSMK